MFFLIILICLFGFSFFFNFGFSQNSSNILVGDCSIVNNYFGDSLDSFYIEKFKKYDDVFPSYDIKIAATHLAYYCCEKDILQTVGLGNKCPTIDSSGNLPAYLLYPESLSLFDHILDIGFRRLSGSDDEQYDSAGIDSFAQDWRQKITKIATEVQGAIPGSVIAHFSQFRKLEETSIPFLYISGNFDSLKEIWADLGLKNRHYGMCYVAREIFGDFFDGEINASKVSYILFNRCLSLANSIIEKEYNYVQGIIRLQGANLLHTNAQTYVDGYFVRDRLQNLVHKFSLMHTDWQIISQKVNEGTQYCSGG